MEAVATNQNRIGDALYLYAEQQASVGISNQNHAGPQTQQEINMQLSYYESVYRTYNKNLNNEEKLTRRYIKHEIARLKAALKPTWSNRVLYNSATNRVRNLINGNNLVYKHFDDRIRQLQTDLIVGYNTTYLTSTLQKHGFKTNLEPVLKKMLSHNLPFFHIRYTDVANGNTNYILHFKKDASGGYSFEKFDATSVHPEKNQYSERPETINHTFYINDSFQYSAQEASRLVNGKAICKMENGQDVWASIHPGGTGTEFLQKHAFNIEYALKQLPLTDISELKLQKLIEQIKSGKISEITVNVNGNISKYYIEPSPSKNTIMFYDKMHNQVNPPTSNDQKINKSAKVLKAMNSIESKVVELSRSYKIR